MKKLLKNNVYDILYTKKNGEITERKIIPMNDVHDVVLTLDVTELTTEQVDSLLNKQREYAEYVTVHMQTLYDFNTWMEHTTATATPEEWSKLRSFTLSNIIHISEIKHDSVDINDK